MVVSESSVIIIFSKNSKFHWETFIELTILIFCFLWLKLILIYANVISVNDRKKLTWHLWEGVTPQETPCTKFSLKNPSFDFFLAAFAICFWPFYSCGCSNLLLLLLLLFLLLVVVVFLWGIQSGINLKIIGLHWCLETAAVRGDVLRFP